MFVIIVVLLKVTVACIRRPVDGDKGLPGEYVERGLVNGIEKAVVVEPEFFIDIEWQLGAQRIAMSGRVAKQIVDGRWLWCSFFMYFIARKNDQPR